MVVVAPYEFNFRESATRELYRDDLPSAADVVQGAFVEGIWGEEGGVRTGKRVVTVTGMGREEGNAECVEGFINKSDLGLVGGTTTRPTISYSKLVGVSIVKHGIKVRE